MSAQTNADREAAEYEGHAQRTPAFNSSTLTVDPIPDRGWIAASTWWLFRALAPAFIPGPVHQRGPQIFNDPKLPVGYTFERWSFEDWGLVTILPPQRKNSPDNVGADLDPIRSMIYFHGGAFNYPVNAGHWKLCARFAAELGAEVTLVPTPLAPDNTADEVVPTLVRVYGEFLRRARGKEILFVGDSSGGNLALVVALAAAQAGLPVPHQLILISPWLDLSCTNPVIQSAQKVDPILSARRLRQKAANWVQGNNPLPSDELTIKLKDPYFSPIYASLAPFVAGQTRLTVVSGTFDVLHPDIELFVEKAERAGVNLHYIEGKGQVHVFPLYARVLPEGKLALEKVVEAVKSHSGRRWTAHSSPSARSNSETL
ncbi:alpha/beta-hydrolase [Clavulina sp. PMI_390]|nr:alpha/beta-hydrolase [Clavulina sp. PMI_390]